ncbi:MAG: metalloregulator ArsR/SmtB family transcription factor [Candidatus Cloacimonadota bacterium]|nr:metalloregulator ArsR/SmtB family transcription factor [Candidatus Cloacimonadota bacterium]
MIDEFVVSKLSKLFNIISNQIRIKIIYILMENQALTVTEISEKLNIPQNTLSAHLKILYEGAYLEKKQEWRKIYYSIKEEKLKDILELASLVLYNKWEGNWEKIADAKNKITKKNKTSKKNKKGEK